MCIGTCTYMRAHTQTYTYPTVPYHTIPYHTIRSLPFPTVPYHTVPYPGPTLPHHTKTYHAMPCHTIRSGHTSHNTLIIICIVYRMYTYVRLYVCMHACMHASISTPPSAVVKSVNSWSHQAGMLWHDAGRNGGRLAGRHCPCCFVG